jgi:hypothetical protein
MPAFADGKPRPSCDGFRGGVGGELVEGDFALVDGEDVAVAGFADAGVEEGAGTSVLWRSCSEARRSMSSPTSVDTMRTIWVGYLRAEAIPQH